MQGVVEISRAKKCSIDLRQPVHAISDEVKAHIVKNNPRCLKRKLAIGAELDGNQLGHLRSGLISTGDIV